MAAARVIGNRILKPNRASVNYCRFFSSNRSYHELNNRPNKDLEMQHKVEKLTNGSGKEVERLYDEIQNMRREMKEGFALQRLEIQDRFDDISEGGKYDWIYKRLCITAAVLVVTKFVVRACEVI